MLERNPKDWTTFALKIGLLKGRMKNSLSESVTTNLVKGLLKFKSVNMQYFVQQV